MKKLMMLTIAAGLAFSLSAQRGHGRGGGRVIVVRPSFGYGYSSFYNSPFGFSPFGYPYGSPYAYNNGTRRESKLDRQIDEIKADYSDKIKSAKSDKTISRDERKKIVRQLKTDRDKTVHDIKANYYKTPVNTTAP